MRYEIRLFPAATWNPSTETHDLGAAADLLASFDAPYPGAAHAAAEATILATRTETTTRMQRGKRVVLTAYLRVSDALSAWQTANGVAALVLTADRG